MSQGLRAGQRTGGRWEDLPEKEKRWGFPAKELGVGCKNARERVVAGLGFPPEMGLGRMGTSDWAGLLPVLPGFFCFFFNLDLCPIIFSKHCCGFFSLHE
jgi:hypothetical protein